MGINTFSFEVKPLEVITPVKEEMGNKEKKQFSNWNFHYSEFNLNKYPKMFLFAHQISRFSTKNNILRS